MPPNGVDGISEGLRVSAPSSGVSCSVSRLNLSSGDDRVDSLPQGIRILLAVDWSTLPLDGAITPQRLADRSQRERRLTGGIEKCSRGCHHVKPPGLLRVAGP